MPWSSGGLFTRVHDWATDLTNQVVITASRMDAEDDNLAAGIDDCLHKDGRNAGNPQFGYFINTGTAMAVLDTQTQLTALDINSSQTPTEVYVADSEYAIWVYDASSVSAEVTNEIQAPDSGSGRWHRRDIRATASTAQMQAGTSTSVLFMTPALIFTAIDARLDDDLTIAGNHTFSGTVTFTTDLEVRSTDDGASAAPFFVTARDSVTPAAADLTGGFASQGKDSAGNDTIYARWVGEITDPTNPNEYGAYVLQAMINGTLTNILRVGALDTSDTSIQGMDLLVGEIRDSGNTFVDIYTSPTGTTLNNDSTLEEAHGLGALPDFVVALLECQTADAGYVAGETIYFPSNCANTGDIGATIDADTSNVRFTQGLQIKVVEKSGGASPFNVQAITDAKWKVKLKAWKYNT